jgi:hypothetical protein
MTPIATSPAPHIPRRRWGIALLLGFGVLVNYFDRVNLSVSQDALHNAFGISTVMFGYLLSAYSWSYAAFQHPPFPPTQKPSAIGSRRKSAAWPRRFLIPRQNLPLRLASR